MTICCSQFTKLLLNTNRPIFVQTYQRAAKLRESGVWSSVKSTLPSGYPRSEIHPWRTSLGPADVLFNRLLSLDDKGWRAYKLEMLDDDEIFMTGDPVIDQWERELQQRTEDVESATH